MTNRPQTIQIYLPGGDPRGIRIAEITTRIVQVVDVPRSLLSEFLILPESKRVAVYFLVGEGADTEEPQLYVGQTSDLQMRLSSHNREKDFWQRALVVVSRTESLTQTHALFLEWHFLQEARKAARYTTVNGNNASRPHTPAPLEADCFEIFDTARVLLSTLGHPVFEPLAGSAISSSDKELMFCTGAGTNGRGYFTPDGFVVLKGSTGRKEIVPSAVGTSHDRLRAKLVESGVLRLDSDKIVLEKDHLFSTPSAAAATLMGRATNGWEQWKNANGQTLDQLKRPAAS